MNSDRRFGWGMVFAAFLLGLFLGWFGIGWGLWPVEWKNTDPIDLRQEAREDYLVMVANDYALTRDRATALRRLATWESLTDAGREIRQLAAYYEAQGQREKAQNLKALAEGLSPPGTVVTTPVPEEAVPSAGEGKLPGWALQVLWILAAILVVVGLGYLAFRLLSLREPRPPRGARRGQAEAPEEGEGIEEEERGRKAPAFVSKVLSPPGAKERLLGEFVLEYEYNGEGEEFEHIRVLESEDGKEYFGECGMGVASFLDQDSRLVNALEVWLFDKSDIRSETKVLMSRQAYEDDELREKLTRRGEPMLVGAGEPFSLEGHSLRAEAKVEEVQYRAGYAQESVFERVSVRLWVYRRQKGEQR